MGEREDTLVGFLPEGTWFSAETLTQEQERWEGLGQMEGHQAQERRLLVDTCAP